MHQDSLLEPRPAWFLPGLAAIAAHGALTATQLAALLVEPADDVASALDALARDGVLKPLSAVSPAGLVTAFTLTRRGAALVESAGGPGRAGARPRSAFTLAHDLARNDVAIALQLLDRAGELRLARFETTRARIAESVVLMRAGVPERVALVADALAVFTTAAGPSALLIEIDRGTVSLARMRRKFAGYAAWHATGGPERRFGIRGLRVATIAKGEQRLERLRRAAREATEGRGGGLFWFLDQRHVDLARPEETLAPRWCTATDDGPLRLFPKS